MALLRMQFRMERQESTSSTQKAKKTKSALLPAYTPQTIKMKQKPWKQQQPTLKSALNFLPMLSSLRMPCLSSGPSGQTGTQNTTTCLLLLPPFVEAVQSPCSGFPPTATCLATRLLIFWQRKTQQTSKSTSYSEVKTILKAKQHSKWRHKHSQYNKADPYNLLTRRKQVTLFRLRTGHNCLNITCIPNSATAIQSSALVALAVRQQNIYFSPAQSMSHSERESGQTTLL